MEFNNNKVQLIGKAVDGRPEIKCNKDQSLVANFRLSVERPGDDKQDWIGIVCWGELAKKASEIEAGQELLVKGCLRTRSWEKNGQRFRAMDVHATSFEVLKK